MSEQATESKITLAYDRDSGTMAIYRDDVKRWEGEGLKEALAVIGVDVIYTEVDYWRGTWPDAAYPNSARIMFESEAMLERAVWQEDMNLYHDPETDSYWDDDGEFVDPDDRDDDEDA